MVAAARSPVFRGRCPGHGAWALGLAVITMLEVFAAAKPTLLLNRSPSEPPGLYVRAGRDLGVGSIIAVRCVSLCQSEHGLSTSSALAQGGRRGTG
jgi:hypothetical protein